MTNGVTETTWLRQLPQEPHNPLSRSTLVYCDNVNAIYLSTNSVQHQRTNHVKLDLHFVCEQVAVGDVRVLHVWITSRLADIFIKGLPTLVFEEFRFSLKHNIFIKGLPTLVFEEFRFSLKHLVWLEFQLQEVSYCVYSV
jgi:hypothetical protein